ncbi:MAG: dUTP diphosphatase, partial [Oscillospiraceae bacterium]
MTLEIRRVRPAAVLPERATAGSAGMDLRACIEAPLVLEAGEIRVIPTGIAIAAPAGTAALIFGRSGLGIRNGVSPANAVGVIDSDYRGEIQVGLINHAREAYTIEPGERIAQLVLIPVCLPEVCEAETLG